MNYSTPVLIPMTNEARATFQGEEIKLHKFPFRIGRECRLNSEGQMKRREHSKLIFPPNNDLYLIDQGKFLSVSREHFQIDKKGDGTYELVDRGSTCGTIVNNKVVGGHDRGGSCLLQDGDVIVVGTPRSTFVFKFLSSATQNQT